ncbi:TauD/TfdA dioxygenase family protein [Ottowia thiooxydans]|uniref:TauD/TfdA dioxygenase family protein n=1 Tax=Ottowia thiooxydans TaxID=219182 RepID=UPI0003FBCC5E|nr:TauD/TfdA family dioxygenase [Ottowia thiooxydans]
MALTINPINGMLGVEISGIDLSRPVDTETKQELNALFSRYAVLVFRDQPLSPPQFMKAAEVFGELMDQQIKQFVLPDYPLVGANSTKDLPRKNGKLQVRGENYHTDHSNHLKPPKATSLVAVEIPSYGGDTQFVDVRRAYADLPEAVKQKIATLRSMHVHQSSHSPRSFAKLSPEEMANIPHVLQPLVIRHPVSGEPALYLNTGRMEGIQGMSPEEGFALIAELYAHATQSIYEYRHKWRAGDMVIWDNRSVMHQANADYDPEEYRYLYRVMLNGEALIPAFE